MKEVKEVVHVPTRELAEEVLRVAKENGLYRFRLDLSEMVEFYGHNLCICFKGQWMSRVDDKRNEGYSVVTAEEFLDRYKPKFRPIAMRCTQEQFDAVRSKLVGLKVRNLSTFEYCPYLVNNFSGDNLVISNIHEDEKLKFNRQVFEEWNEKTFLEYCGISIGTEDSHKDLIKGEWKTQDELTLELSALKMENEELKQQLKDLLDQPKVGDVCLFWDEGIDGFSINTLSEIKINEPFLYRVEDGSGYGCCIKATDENIKAKIKELQDE